MIVLELTSDEANELYTIIKNILSDLRMEIAGTDNADFREGLKWREMLLEKLLGDIERQGPIAGRPAS